MGSYAKPRSAVWYSRLLVLYPASYRRQYARPMVQAFDDLLGGEPSRAGRCLIWARATWDIPTSALKEHITNGEFTMSRNFKILMASIVLLLLVANGASYWFGSIHAWRAESVQRTTPSQMADAMQHDHFYSSYGKSAVLFSGKVTSARPSGDDSLVAFETDRPYSVTCQFSGKISAKAGDTIAVTTAAGSADRQKAGVLLHDCVTD